MRKNKISETISNINQKYVNEAIDYTVETTAVHQKEWMKWGVIAACFMIVTVLSIDIFQRWHFGGEQIVILDNGNKINFIKSDSVIRQFDIDFQIETRSLLENEIKAMFNELPVTAYAIFNAEDGSILGIEGEIDDMKLRVSVPDVVLSDAIIEGEEHTSVVEGVYVNAGYFISGKTVIYYASFTLGESKVYIENAGAEEESETVKNDISIMIQELVSLREINLNQLCFS